MSRSGYSEDLDNWAMIKWRGQVASAIRGTRGQKLLADLLTALDAMPEKALVMSELETDDGEVCALGALGRARGMDLHSIDPEDPDSVAAAFDIAPQLAQEIVYMNDENFDRRWDDGARNFVDFTPGERWTAMRAWVFCKVAAVKEQG